VTAFGVWKRLDLDRTDDVAAIRRAYARQLKQTDVEADPEAFIALREALERALAYAADRASRATAESGLRDDTPAPPPAGELTAPEVLLEAGPDVVGIEAPAPQRVDFRIAPEAAAAGGGKAEAVAVPAGAALLAAPDLAEADSQGGLVLAFEGGAPADEHALRDLRFQRLRLLLSVEEPPPAAEIRQAAAAILADPQMTNLKYSAEVEAWLADAICASSPRSDPVIAETVPYFGWDSDFGKLGQPDQVTAIVARWRGLMFLERVSQPGHEFHGAWKELTRLDEGEFIWNRWLIEGKVRSLLSVIREKFPAAEGGLEPYRVGLWDRYFNPNAYPGDLHEGLGWGSIFLIIFPPAAVAIAYSNHNSARFRTGLVIWTVLWTIWLVLSWISGA
jgi:hypothetical protein